MLVALASGNRYGSLVLKETLSQQTVYGGQEARLVITVTIYKLALLGGSWVVISGVISGGVASIIIRTGGLIRPLITAHEPPSKDIEQSETPLHPLSHVAAATKTKTPLTTLTNLLILMCSREQFK